MKLSPTEFPAGDFSVGDDNVFAIRNLLYDMIKYKRGKWCNAWLIGEYKYIGERERLANELGAEIINLD